MSASEVVEARREGVSTHGAPVDTASPVPLPEAAVAERRSGSQRLANVERLRLVAMFEIVAFHVSEHRLPIIAGLGLPSFLLLNNAFNCTLSARMGTRAFLRTKVSKLLLPWLVWSALYALVIVLEKLRHHESVTEAFSPWMLVGGTYIHLWFVPFALAGGLFAAGLQARTKQASAGLMTIVMLSFGGALLAGCAWLIGHRQVEWPALQWLFALPSPLLGFALGRTILAADRKLLLAVVVGTSLLAVACQALASYADVPSMVTRYATSLALVALAFLWPGRPDRFSQRLTPLLFGIYLTHPLIVRTYMALHLPSLGVFPLALLVFFGSVLLVVALRRTPLRSLV